MSSILFPDSSYIPPAPSSVKGLKRENKFNKKFLYFGGGFAILIISIIAGALWGGKIDSTVPNDDKIIKEVSKLIDLPQGEKPVIATVTEKELANTSNFFSKSQIGDKILVYKTSKKAILYRSSEGKIIEVGTISDANDVAGAKTSATASPTPSSATQVSPTLSATSSAQVN